jgi:hypothetical protein
MKVQITLKVCQFFEKNYFNCKTSGVQLNVLDINANRQYNGERKEMDKKKPLGWEEETRRLTFAIIFMSMFILVLFGLGPSV